jgi:hypothetical protein
LIFVQERLTCNTTTTTLPSLLHYQPPPPKDSDIIQFSDDYLKQKMLELLNYFLFFGEEYEIQKKLFNKLTQKIKVWRDKFKIEKSPFLFVGGGEDLV